MQSLFNLAQIIFENIWRGELRMNTHQVAWVLLSAISNLWLIICSGLLVQAISSWANTSMPIVAKILTAAILLWVGSHPSQLLFHAARERVTAQNPRKTNGNLGRE